MPGYLLNADADVKCTHISGSVKGRPGASRVKVARSAVVTAGDAYLVSGCLFTLPPPVPKPQPCIQTNWFVTATRVKVEGKFVILSTSAGICTTAEQIPQGPPVVMVVQQRVKGI
jgi:hypothetical protein